VVLIVAAAIPARLISRAAVTPEVSSERATQFFLPGHCQIYLIDSWPQFGSP
jgi:hypothetical protein